MTTSAQVNEAENAAKRYCLDCECFWRGAVPCLLCGAEGVLGEFREPEGWPRLTVAAGAVLPGRPA